MTSWMGEFTMIGKYYNIFLSLISGRISSCPFNGHFNNDRDVSTLSTGFHKVMSSTGFYLRFCLWKNCTPLIQLLTRRQVLLLQVDHNVSFLSGARKKLSSAPPPVSIIEFRNLQFYMRRRPKKCQFIISELCRVYIDVNFGPTTAVFVPAEL